MNNFKFTLEPYRRGNRYDCPNENCLGRKTFARYIDTETNNYIHPTVGRCDRTDKCGYHYKPLEYFKDNNHLQVGLHSRPQQIKTHYKNTVKPHSTIPFNILKESFGKAQDNNNFIIFLKNKFGDKIAKKMVEDYYITTSKLWKGANVFWQIDHDKHIRAGKIMLYGPVSGKRDKTKNSWVHTALGLTDFRLKQCWFGEQLLEKNRKIVAIVESDKTAVLMSYYMPEYVWLSSSGKFGLNLEKFKVLKGRTVVLFPDLSSPDSKMNCFELWCKKAKEFGKIAHITVSDYLEKHATTADRLAGLDIADYFLKSHANTIDELKVMFSSENFREPKYYKGYKFTFNGIEREPAPEMESIPQAENWDIEIDKLSKYFESAPLPKLPIKLNPHTTIQNVAEFIKSTMNTVIYNNGKARFLPYLERLRELQEWLGNHL